MNVLVRHLTAYHQAIQRTGMAAENDGKMLLMHQPFFLHPPIKPEVVVDEVVVVVLSVLLINSFRNPR